MIDSAMLRWGLCGLVVLAGCFESHGSMDQTINQTDCYSCHKPDYNATGGPMYPAPIPAHASMGCSTDCVLCHTTTTWVNYLGGCTHPEQNFPLMSQGTQHNNITCNACHSEAISIATGASSVKGANTDCISCHPNNAAQQMNHNSGTLGYTNGGLPVTVYNYSTTDHRFCLDCHPTGLQLSAHASGNACRIPHNGATCAQCHDYASGLGATGGADVTCSGNGNRGGGDGCHSTRPQGFPQCSGN